MLPTSLKTFFCLDCGIVHADYVTDTDISTLVTVLCYSVLEIVGLIIIVFGNFIVLSIDFLQWFSAMDLMILASCGFYMRIFYTTQMYQV